jgi:Skp family chaperone for outer membrane proteins
MKSHLITLSALALSAAAAVPAAAQVNGIGVAEPAAAIGGAQAVQTAYSQIETTFAAQLTQINQLQTQRDTLARQFDTDGDGQLSDAEQTAAQGNAAVMQQLQTLEQTIAQTGAPIQLARIYAIEQVAMQFSAAVQQVITANGVSIILSPASVVYAADATNLTDDIAARLNQLVPTVSTAVPAGWQPARQSVALYQEIQQLRLNAAIAQAQQQAAQAQQPAAQGR